MSDTIEQLARRARRWIAIEELLFETLGRWARELPDAATRSRFATWCHRHAWHAELWRERLPAVVESDDDVEAWVAPLRSALGSVTTSDDALAVFGGPIADALSSALAEHRDAIDPLLDGPTARVLDLISADLDNEIGVFRADTPVTKHSDARR